MLLLYDAFVIYGWQCRRNLSWAAGRLVVLNEYIEVLLVFSESSHLISRVSTELEVVTFDFISV